MCELKVPNYLTTAITGHKDSSLLTVGRDKKILRRYLGKKWSQQSSWWLSDYIRAVFSEYNWLALADINISHLNTSESFSLLSLVFRLRLGKLFIFLRILLSSTKAELVNLNVGHNIQCLPLPVIIQRVLWINKNKIVDSRNIWDCLNAACFLLMASKESHGDQFSVRKMTNEF